MGSTVGTEVPLKWSHWQQPSCGCGMGYGCTLCSGPALARGAGRSAPWLAPQSCAFCSWTWSAYWPVDSPFWVPVGDAWLEQLVKKIQGGPGIQGLPRSHCASRVRPWQLVTVDLGCGGRKVTTCVCVCTHACTCSRSQGVLTVSALCMSRLCRG